MKRLAAPLCALLLGACAYSGPRVVGAWSGIHDQSGPNTLTFRENGTATWTFDAPEVGTFELTYAIRYRGNPHQIELRGFDRGVLAGRVLYGILEFLADDRFRFAAAAGEPDDAERRPRDFADAQIYTRDPTSR